MRKKRTILPNRCYHLVSRVAHRAFFFDEVGSFEDWSVQHIKDVLDGKADRREIAGNVFKLVIEKEFSTVYDTLADDEKGDQCTVQTQELLSLIGQWHEQKALLREQ